MRASLSQVEGSKNRRTKLYRLLVSFRGEGIFANPSEFVGSGKGYRMGCYPVEGKGNELISFQPLGGFYLPCDDYKVCRR